MSLLPAPRVSLLDYSKRAISVRGWFWADVIFKGCSAQLLFYVVHQGTSLIGLDDIKALKIRIESATLQCLQSFVIREE